MSPTRGACPSVGRAPGAARCGRHREVPAGAGRQLAGPTRMVLSDQAGTVTSYDRPSTWTRTGAAGQPLWWTRTVVVPSGARKATWSRAPDVVVDETRTDPRGMNRAACPST